MAKTFRPYAPDQIRLLPANLAEWLPADHLARFVDEAVTTLDLGQIEAGYQEERGYPPYHPQMMTKVLIYGYAVGVRSSRKIERRLHEDVAFRYLGADNFPDHKAISEFRRRHLGALGGLFRQVVEICQRLQMVKLGHLAIDSTKVRANASKHNAMSYGRMKSEDERLKREIQRMLQEAEEVDQAEDKEHGDSRGGELPQALQDAATRRRKIQEAIAALKREAEPRQPDQDPETVEPEDKAQRNFTDPDSRIMRSAGNSFEQAYQVQIGADPEFQVIVSTEVSQHSADAGYFSADNVRTLIDLEMDPFIPPNKIGRTDRRHLEPDGAPLAEDASWADRMRAKLKGPVQYRPYQLRQKTVEPIFGQIKEVRNFRRFSLRGLEKVQAEWFLIAATHNLLKTHRYQGSVAPPPCSRSGAHQALHPNIAPPPASHRSLAQQRRPSNRASDAQAKFGSRYGHELLGVCNSF